MSGKPEKSSARRAVSERGTAQSCFMPSTELKLVGAGCVLRAVIEDYRGGL